MREAIGIKMNGQARDGKFLSEGKENIQNRYDKVVDWIIELQKKYNRLLCLVAYAVP